MKKIKVIIIRNEVGMNIKNEKRYVISGAYSADGVLLNTWKFPTGTVAMAEITKKKSINILHEQHEK